MSNSALPVFSFSTAPVLFVLLVGAIAGFAVGWISKRDEARRYLESRERYWRRQLADALNDRDRAVELAAVREPQQPGPTVVNVVIPSAGWPQPQVFTAPIVPALTVSPDVAS